MRLIELRSTLLGTECIALSFQAQEHLSREPLYRLDLMAPDPDLDLDGLLGSAIAIDIDLGEGRVRTFHCHVLAACDTGQKDDKFTYTLELGSWLSFLDESHDCRIFQSFGVPEIVEQVFVAHRRADFKFELERNYPPREYCVQFGESDLNFVRRLLEVEGIYFWVVHEAERHVVVMSDTQNFEAMPLPYETLRFLPDGEEQRAIAGREGVQRLQRTRRIRPTNVAFRDFNYHIPGNSLDSDARFEHETPGGVALEHYDYAPGYFDAERGERLARLRLEGLRAESHQLLGQSNARGLTVAKAFTLEGHPDERRNRRYHVTGTDLRFVQDGPDSSSTGRNVGVDFRALADDQPFRPLLLTPRPTVSGIQSATVVGPPGSEVHTDKLGRIRVHFHWDRYKNTEEDASSWIRVSQAWAGKGWGVLAIPRVGQEVLVTYVDGDLDRPLVTGIVYNGENPTPYDLPKDIRYSGMVTRSLNQGHYRNASQLTFDDQRGAERIMLHAERDMQQTVERNSSVAIGQDMNTKVDGTKTTTTKAKISHDPYKISYTGIGISFTGISVSYVGVSTSFRGVSTSFDGVSTSFTGVGTSFRGISTSFDGVSTSFAGVSNSFKGVSTSFTGLNMSSTGVSMSMTGISNSMTGVSSSMTGMSQSMTGTSCSIVGSSSSIVGASNSITGSSLAIVNAAISHTNTRVSTTAVSTAFTGLDISAKGNSISTTAVDFSTKGVSTSITGLSISITGQKIDEKTIATEISQMVSQTFGIQIKN